MVEIGASEFHPIPNAKPIQPSKPFQNSFYSGELPVRCEDCPSSKICKKIGNFRKSCDPGMAPVSPNDLNMSKCVAGTNMLLARLLERMERG